MLRIDGTTYIDSMSIVFYYPGCCDSCISSMLYHKNRGTDVYCNQTPGINGMESDIWLEIYAAVLRNFIVESKQTDKNEKLFKFIYISKN